MNRISISLLILIVYLSNSSFAQKEEEIFPVELIYFEAMVINVGVLLRWGTATEVNNFGFEVQRANTSLQFETLDFVQGHGNSNSPKHYIFIDSTLPQAGLYFYRLKQIDINGPFHYSDTLNVLYNPLNVENTDSNSPSKFSIKNNSELREISISLPNDFTDGVTLTIFSILGEKISEIPFSSSNEIKYFYNKLSNGIYFLILYSKTKLLFSHKFLVIH